MLGTLGMVTSSLGVAIGRLQEFKTKGKMEDVSVARSTPLWMMRIILLFLDPR
ncbi:hypothetical protein GF319_12890 [Candidatus Bathyarchaeota archaeon]|nr:hypothetical protein [Candidatus Bathyarchaeota archaeon]